MPLFSHRSPMPVSAEQLFRWHAQPGAFERLVPPWEQVRVVKRAGGIEDGDRLELELKVGPKAVRWVVQHEDYQEGRQFADVQISGPFAAWRHTNAFEPAADGTSFLDDRISYRLPMGRLGTAFGDRVMRAKLARTFAWRHARTRQDLARHQAVGDRPPMRIAVTGATGLVGTALCAFLETGGHRVDRVVRRPAAPGTTEISWDPKAGTIDLAALEGVDAVIHLAGENVGVRWNKAHMQAILESRKQGTRLIAESITRLSRPPRVLISASGTGYYGDGGDEPFDEDHARAGTTFLAEVCQAWEIAAQPARQAGIRVVNARLGAVLSPRGGALQKMLPPFRLGGGGVVGSGRQWMSWIALDDVLGAFLHMLYTDSLHGPVNVTAPQPVTNAEFTRTLAGVLKRPAVFPLPAALVLMMFGEMGQALLLHGQRVVPARLQESGFQFGWPWLEGALRWELGESPAT